jgi:integrase/recombinase XerD
MLTDPSRVRVTGPLSAFAAGFAAELTDQGYTPDSAGYQMRLMAHLSRWLLNKELGASDLRTVKVDRFLRARRATGCRHLLSIKGMRPLLTYLRDLGVAPTTSLPSPSGPVDEVLERYRNYLTVERGLRHATSCGYVAAVRPFLQGRVLPGSSVLDLRHLAASDVIAFVVRRCPRQSRGAAKPTVMACDLYWAFSMSMVLSGGR